jgi:lipid A 4'-phosphatase
VKPALPALIAALALAAAMALLAAFPELDLALARRFYLIEGDSFGARFDAILILLRDLGYFLPPAVLALAMLGWVLGMRNARLGTILTGRRVLFLALSLALGPGLAVNGVLKEVSHRPRPVQVLEFGGQSAFRPWYAFDGACKTNCSFVSGEAAGATWLLAPAALVPQPWRAGATAAAALFAVAVALLRMAFGGHFASDVIGGALVTLATLLAIGWALRRSGGDAAL